MPVSRTIVISCAGMGRRLGFGRTKALVEIDGKSLIARHLEMLEDEQDVRVVVGYQAERVIEAVRKYRNDITFVFNHDYRLTGTGASVALAVNCRRTGEYVLSLDGDLLVHPEDMEKILQCGHEFAGGQPPVTDEPWMLQTCRKNGLEYVKAFSKNEGSYEWNGITQMLSGKMRSGTGHVFQMLEPYLPIPFMELRTREIDTANDYERAVLWVRNGYEDKAGEIDRVKKIWSRIKEQEQKTAEMAERKTDTEITENGNIRLIDDARGGGNRRRVG